ncbi:MAG: response regulator [Deltaproteobacteria bacterium]|nr:response regulator [Deltaproteobacteria bacterium]
MVTQDSKNVIIADDSVFFRTKLSDILVEAGHKVTFAKDGLKLIEGIRAGHDAIDLLILDLQMPEMDGFGVLKWLKANGYAGRFPVLVATGAYEATAIVNDLRELGASGFMSKDSTPEQIIFRVNNLLFPAK